jgi:hypothetical protein
MDCHVLIFQQLAYRRRDLGVQFRKESIVADLLLVVFLNLREAHHPLHMLILRLHLVLDQLRSVATPLIHFSFGHPR